MKKIVQQILSGQSERTGIGGRKRRLLSEAARVEEELVPAFVRPLLALVAVVVLLFILWAAFTPITEVARAPGEVAPSGQVKVVQHLDGGAVAEILVEEKALVQQGQVLVRMDGAQALSDLRQTGVRMVSLRLRAERLGAYVENRAPAFAALAADHPELVGYQQQIYQTQLSTRDSALSILDHQIAQRGDRLAQLRKALTVAQEHQGLTGELATMREDLASRKLVNRSVLLETRRAKVSAEGEVARIGADIKVSEQELAEIRSRRADTLNLLRRDALAEMATVSTELAEVTELQARLQAKVDRLVVRAPVRGYVQDLKVLTLGQVVQPGGLMMQIVPDDVPLEAVVRIAPKDIGYVRVGQQVNLRVSSFDYARFGFAEGRLKRVTATSVVGEDGRPYFRGWVALPNPYVGNRAGRYQLQPGMGVEAEILTGEKTVLAYLSKPLMDMFSRSFRER
ncbi:HlyD family type I secretion periplasmic adaptor subunit [Pseudoduganella namucuonensis]|uniref:Membrane fusion protein (MFP) family protein n=1 Tax=Pseudoduganella namucuonensis TaxID=1035707 RepID=A0A1I7KY49_9BURK|nr:HlyD family type I secretion periplasmic adaptor subunit [Pseudoduganella namucuonensis]SFV02391.1 HlyD family secretion protein/membrane fusion protein, adhesin transport system [Pseudoduganella namucuonensis]